MRHVFTTMGTVASIDGPADLMPAVEQVFEAYDRRFSLYRPDSEISRIARRELALPDASDEMIATYTRALAWRGRTDGAFSPHRPDGVLDLDGIVKAEAIEQAGHLLDAAGCSEWTINVGGDILARGATPVGIVDPAARDTMLCAVILGCDRRALATSGSGERGDHIWRGGEIVAPRFLQVSVLADDIVTADVLATALVAATEAGFDDLLERSPVDVLAVAVDGTLVASPGMRRALVGPVATPP